MNSKVEEMKINGLVFLVFTYFLHVYTSQEHLVSAFVQESGMMNPRGNEKQFTREEGNRVVSVNKIGGVRFTSSAGAGKGAGKAYDGSDGQTGDTTTPKSPNIPGTPSAIPLYTAAGAAHKYNKPHSGASGPKHSQVGFGITAVRIAILAPLVLMLGSFCL